MLSLILNLLTIISLCYAQKRRAQRSIKQGGNIEDHYNGLIIIGIVFLLAILPPIIYFIYSVYKDPLTPEIMGKLTEIVKERSLGYLGKKPRIKRR